MYGVKLHNHPLRLRVMAFAELHWIPAVFAPVLPVLHQCVDWNVSLPEFCRDVEDLLLTGIAFSTLPISVRPFGKQRRFASKLAVVGDDAVQLWSVKTVIVNCLADF